MAIRQEVSKYIKDRWKDTIHFPEEKNHGMVRIPRPYSVPCANVKGMYTDFFYWDTYFTNLGFLADGYTEQAENNLDIMDYFVRNLGYVPNANHLLDRSQPPLLSRGVWDLYLYTGEKRIAEKYMHTVERCLEQSGALWEKYDAKQGTVSVTSGYHTPEMMGWTAGVYRFLAEKS